MKIRKEVILGFVVVISFALLYWGINFLKGKDVFSQDRIFYAVYDDVGGLVATNPVFINGLNIGQIRSLSFADHNSASVIIAMNITDDIPIPANSVAHIFSSDIIGSKALEIQLGNAEELAMPGDTLISTSEESIKEAFNREFKPIKDKASELMSSIDTVISMLQDVFGESNQMNLASSVENIAKTFKNLESTTGAIDTLLDSEKNRFAAILFNLESITRNLNENEEVINEIFTNLNAVSDTLTRVDLASTFLSTKNTLDNFNSMIENVNSGQGTLGQLLNDDSLYIQLKNSSTDLDLLLQDIKANPKKYVKFSVF